MDKPVQSGPPVLLRTMGAMRLSNALGQDLTPRGRKARALLVILALEPAAVPRDRLADLLWSDRGSEQARSSLRQSLFELRHLDDGDAGLVVSERDDLAFGRTVAWTDLDALRHAAGTGNSRAAIALLEAAGDGLLTDLDGLDPELDGWLRQLRAIEPGRTLAAAMRLAEAALDEGDIAAATAIVTQVQRLDPASEEAARLGIRIAHRLGDNAAIARHYRQLCETLRDEYDAEPSGETEALMAEIGRRKVQPSGHPATQPDDAPRPAPPAATDGVPAKRWNIRRSGWGLAGLGLAGAGALAWLAWPTAINTGGALPLVAVLPFDQYPAGDGALAEGIWDDTRSTLSRAQAVRVLGRTTSEALAARQWSPADYRKNLDVDYLLDGGVRRQGDRVRVTVSLIRTADGVAIWEHAFDGRLGDAMALQGAIAQGIEGRVRGRLASGGGAKAEQIPTTPKVYELYLRSKRLLKNRTASDAQQAKVLLDRAIALDPNYAPALALSATSLHFSAHGPDSDQHWRSKAIARAHRAIDLAPGLAEAYAAAAFVEGSSSPVSEQMLVKATRLDPGDAQSWLWLGNAQNARGNWRGAAASYRRAVEIDPYFAPALDNYADALLGRNEQEEFAALLTRLDRAGGDATLVPALKAQAAFHAGDVSTSIRLVQPLIAERDAPSYAVWQAAEGFFALGYVRRGGQLLQLAPTTIAVLEGSPAIDMSRIGRELMINSFGAPATIRLALMSGQSRSVVAAYRRNFAGADDFIEAVGGAGDPGSMGPAIALALRQQGQDDEARRLLEAARSKALSDLGAQPFSPEARVMLARILAVTGEHSRALKGLDQAVAAGWIPDGIFVPGDIALEPTLRLLDGPQFQSIRRRILANISRERRELGKLQV